MQMNMVDRLPRPGITVHHHAVARFGHAFISGDLLRGQDHFTHQVDRLRRQVIGRGNMCLWNHQHMHRCLRIDITKREYIVILKDNIRLNLPRHHLAE